MEQMYVTYLQHPEEDENYNKYDGFHNPFVIHNSKQWHFGRFPSMQKLKEFLDFAGLTMELIEETNRTKGGKFKKWTIDCNLDDHHSFKDITELPRDAKPFIGLSNGSLVTCYLLNDGSVLHVYRPNPNAKKVYRPLSIQEHIEYCIVNGYV